MQELFGKFSSNLQKILITAERIAREQNSILDTEHILLSMVLAKGTLSSDILSLYKISSEQIQLILRLASKEAIPLKSKGMTKDAKTALQLSVHYASKYKHRLVDSEHLLLALVSNKNFNSYNALERIGANPKEIKNQIEAIFREIDKTKEDMILKNNNQAIIPNDVLFGPINTAGLTRTKAKTESILKMFTSSITKMARESKLDPIIGRDNEIDRITQVLSRRKKNNPILIGDPGVGKTAIVEGLAQRIVDGEVPTKIMDKEIVSLDLGALLAGTMYRGQFESRIKNILSEIKRKKNILLFIDEIHTVIGAGSSEGSLDAANILKLPLARGEIQIIGATTFDEFKKQIEKDSAFERRFQPILVNENSEDESIKILKGIKSKYEQHHSVKYLDDALSAAVKLSHRYIQDRKLPDKAIDLIDEAAAATNIVNPKTRKHAKLSRTLHKVIQRKDEAVTNEQYELASKLRQQEIKLTNQLKKINIDQDEIKIIGVDDIATIVSKWSGIPVTSLTVSEKKSFLNLEKILSKYIVGQKQAIKDISQAIRRSRAGISDPKRPIGSFIFLGPTGVGKTELVKVLAREVFGREQSLIKLDMSEFMEKHNVARLVGAPAGYVGYDEGGKLTETIRKQPYSLILFDEIEKAHPEVFNILLQILEDGELSDAKGRRVDFRNTMIIMTSNLGTDKLIRGAKIGFSNSKKSSLDYKKLSENVLENIEKNFRPEFLNRLDKLIIFHPLTKKDIGKIIDLEISKLKKRIAEHSIDIQITKQAKDWMIDKGYIPEYGARPLRRVISENIESPLSLGILDEKYKSGDNVKVILSNNRILLTHG